MFCTGSVSWRLTTAILQYVLAVDEPTLDHWQWLAYCQFHMGDYKRAMQTLQKMQKMVGADKAVHVYLACCYFFLGMYKEAEEEVKRGPSSRLQNRLQFHLSYKLNDERRLMSHHQLLQDVPEDQLTLASIHYLRGHYQEAIDIYKRLLQENK